MKAQCVTGSETPTGDGFDIDYVVHEMGHACGADHTFNTQAGSCAGNGVPTQAYEPGSGSTIMAYAGICTPDNIQAHSDDYFHAASLRQIYSYLSTEGDGCAVKSATNNKPAGVASFGGNYTIPSRTPFELEAPATTDSTGGSAISYCWEQWNLGGFGQTQVNVSAAGPLFRSFAPVAVPGRMFPKLDMVRNGIMSNAGVDNASGEKLPEVARYLTFKLTVRSLHGNYGCFTIPDDTLHIDVANSGSTGFSVTSQNTAGVSYQGYDNETITWNVAGTNGAPVNASNVDIYMSPDKGNTWPYHLGTFPNNGSATVSIPNPDTNITAARFKVKGTGNVFFNINSKDFSVTRNFASSLTLFPVPASHTLHISSDNNGLLHAVVYNMVGRQQWEGDITGPMDLPVYLWARGVYIMKLVDGSNRRAIKRFVVQ
jgi:hypothetical protein